MSRLYTLVNIAGKVNLSITVGVEGSATNLRGIDGRQHFQCPVALSVALSDARDIMIHTHSIKIRKYQ